MSDLQNKTYDQMFKIVKNLSEKMPYLMENQTFKKLYDWLLWDVPSEVIDEIVGKAEVFILISVMKEECIDEIEIEL